MFIPSLLVCILSSSNGLAGGLLFPDLGTVALGRGGAFTAKADDGTAFYYNPAGLTKIDGVNLYAGLNLVDCNVLFQRKGTGEPVHLAGHPFPIDNPRYDNTYPQVQNKPYYPVSQATPIGLSGAAFVGTWSNAFNVKGLTLTAGTYAPSGFGPSYDKYGASRYSMIYSKSIIIYPGVGIAYAFNRYLRIGAIFLSGMTFIDQKVAARVTAILEDEYHNEDRGGDANVSVKAHDLFMPTGIFGIQASPADWLELGLTVRLPAYIKAKGTIAWQAPEEDMSSSTVKDGTSKLSFHFPWVVSGGLRFITQRLDVEVDFVWENWNSFDGIESDLNGTVDMYGDGSSLTDLQAAFIPKYFNNTYSFRIGSDVELWPDNLTARFGGYYQSSAYKKGNQTFSVDFPFGQQFGLGAGLSWHAFGIFDISVAYLRVIQADVEVTKGIVQQQGQKIDLGDGNQYAAGNTVNNGTYKVDMNIFSGSISATF